MMSNCVVFVAMVVMLCTCASGFLPHHSPASIVRRTMSGFATLERPVYSHLVEIRLSKSRLAMSMVTEAPPAVPGAVHTSAHAVGEQHEGIVSKVRAYGAVVNITDGCSVVLPRSKMSRGTFARLKAATMTSAYRPKVKLEITSISVNGTLGGKYLPLEGGAMQDPTVLTTTEWRHKRLNATVVGTHEFGLFAELDAFGVEGLIPASMIPKEIISGTIMKTFSPGMQIEVFVESYNPVDKKLALSMREPSSSPGTSRSGRSASTTGQVGNRDADLTAFSKKSPERWMQALVQRVTTFGLFVRPANYDVVGMVHVSRVPKALLTILKEQMDSATAAAAIISTDTGDHPPSENPTGGSVMEAGAPETTSTPAAPRTWTSSASKQATTPTPTPTSSTTVRGGGGGRRATAQAESQVDLTAVFSPGDVVRVRVFGVNTDKQQVDLSMLPYKPGERDNEEQDGYVVEGRDPEGEEAQAEDLQRQQQERERAAAFDPEDCLIWWRGDAYMKAAQRQQRDMTPAQRRALMDREAERVIFESRDVIDGTWRRMFELDMRQDQNDFSGKGLRREMEELAAEIGCMEGLDPRSIIDTDPYRRSDPVDKVRLGSFIDPSFFPPAWRENITFYREVEEREKAIQARLRAGKKGDQLEIEEVLRAAQQRTEQLRAKGGGGGGGGRSRGKGGRGAEQASGGVGHDGGEDIAVRRWQRASEGDGAGVTPSPEAIAASQLAGGEPAQETQ